MTAKASDAERARIVEYVESRLDDEDVVHTELVRSETVAGTTHDIWNVITEKGRWWVVTGPTNLYTQNDFKSADVVLTFHIGLMTRVLTRDNVPVSSSAADVFGEVWRRWETAVDALSVAVEAEDFQAVAMRLREAYVALLKAVQEAGIVPQSNVQPPSASPEWLEKLAGHLAAGDSNRRLRAYLKHNAADTWAHVNWLTHESNALRIDAEIAVANVSHLVSVFTASLMRFSRLPQLRCAECGSYRVVAGDCMRCGWRDDEYVESEREPIDDEERAKRLAEPHIPSSDISTFDGPDNYR